MRYLFITALLVFCSCLMAQDQAGNPPDEIIKYYFVELKTNVDRAELAKHKIDSIQRAHFIYMAKMAENGQLMLGGPFKGGGGIFILKAQNMEEAEQLVANDPTVYSGRLIPEIRIWYTKKGAFTQELKQQEEH
ncbi:MAG: YciI family protein [Fulvivirga sp.]|nr:YciI family protein [Fulvivirga sp.]